MADEIVFIEREAIYCIGRYRVTIADCLNDVAKHWKNVDLVLVQPTGKIEFAVVIKVSERKRESGG